MNVFNSILILVAAFFAVFFQSAYSGFRHVLGVQIDFLPGLMVYTALYAGFPSITLLSILGGLWFDSLSANPLGVSILPHFILGLAIYHYRGMILRDQLYAQYLLGFMANALVPLGTLLVIKTIGGTPLLSWFSLWEWLILSLAGGLLTMLIFFVFERLHRVFNYQPVTPGPFRKDREIKRGRL